MPMHHARSDLDDIARFEPTGRFPLFLIVSLAADTDEKLSSRVAVPIVAASRFEGYVRYRYIKFIHRSKSGQP